jgi:molecular chaperone GrpE
MGSNMEKGEENRLEAEAPQGGNEGGSDRVDEEPSSVPAEELAPSGEEGAELSEAELSQREIVLLEGQLQDMRDRYLRAAADLDNARKRARREMAEAQVQAIADVLVELLPIVDNFERALETSRPGPEAPVETRAVHEGVTLIYRQLMDMLAGRGVMPIEALGQPFDPAVHEAVAKVAAGEEEEEGTVAVEMQRGYRLGERVLRPSKVGVVASEGEPRGAADEESGEAG